VAAVTLHSPVTEDELMQFLSGRLTRYQRPVAIKVVDQLPRTPSLKISRALVREHYFDGVTHDEAVAAAGASPEDAAMTGEPS
jgi:acyl-CoA synthetase (AMP-forming)/AMP-acid ligase II